MNSTSPSPPISQTRLPPGWFICVSPTAAQSNTSDLLPTSAFQLIPPPPVSAQSSLSPRLPTLAFQPHIESQSRQIKTMAGRTPRSITSTWRADPQSAAIPPPPLFPPRPPGAMQVGPFMPYAAFTSRGSDFVVQHICARCYRPRSVSFHRAHPVAPGSPLPPPGLCGSCKHEIEASENRQVSRHEHHERSHHTSNRDRHRRSR